MTSVEMAERVAQQVRVSCVSKADRANAHERILAIGGVNPDGSRWRLPQEAAIAGIERGEWAFFVERPEGHRAAVVVSVSPSGDKYVKTETDNEQPDNLLALPECP